MELTQMSAYFNGKPEVYLINMLHDQKYVNTVV